MHEVSEKKTARSFRMAFISEINGFFIEDICYRYVLCRNNQESYRFCFSLRPDELKSDHSLFVTRAIWIVKFEIQNSAGFIYKKKKNQLVAAHGDYPCVPAIWNQWQRVLASTGLACCMRQQCGLALGVEIQYVSTVYCLWLGHKPESPTALIVLNQTV